jgi:hypothetical protein
VVPTWCCRSSGRVRCATPSVWWVMSSPTRSSTSIRPPPAIRSEPAAWSAAAPSSSTCRTSWMRLARTSMPWSVVRS